MRNEAEANANADNHNAEAVAEVINSAEWIELPLEPDFVWFPGCEQGQYPQSRRATVSLRFGDVEVEATGYGQSRFIRDSHCHAAVAEALSRVCDAVKSAQGGYFAARKNDVLNRMNRADVVKLCRMLKTA